MSFEESILKIAEYQYTSNKFFQRFCDVMEKTPSSWNSWKDIPPLPVSLYKQFPDVKAFVGNPKYIWESSGTSGSVSRTNLQDSVEYESSIEACWGSCGPKIHDLAIPLVPSASDWPNSSLSHMFSYWVPQHKIASGTVGNTTPKTFELNFQRIVELLEHSELHKEPVTLYGTSYAFVKLFDFLKEEELNFNLPPKSNVIDTGGYKNITRSLSRPGFVEHVWLFLGSQVDSWNEYGMSELSSHFWQKDLGTHVAPNSRVRVRTIDPVTLEDSEGGVLAFYDVGNIHTCVALMTEDVGLAPVEDDSLSRVIPWGRAQGADAKGCGLQAERALGDVK